MKRSFLCLLLLCTGFGLLAQNLDKAKELQKAGKLMDAKAEIDKVLAIDKNQKNGEAWYTKLKIYNGIAASDQLKAQVPDARMQALEALKKYVEVDDKKLVMLQLEQYKPVNEIYQGFFQVGANAYNAGNYADALTSFKGAILTSDFMSEKGWTTVKLDTTSTLYAGISAEKGNNKDEAALYYAKLANARIAKINGANMDQIYKWLADYYNQKKDEANTAKYLALGKEFFPEDLFWPSMELDNLRAKGDKEALFAKYEEITTKFTTNHLFMFNYGLELYQYASDTSKTTKRPANYDELIKKSQQELAKCLELKPDYPQAALVLGQISYNAGVDLQNEAKATKGTKPEDVKKRTDLRAQASKRFDESIPYFEKVEQILGGKGKLKMEEKNALKDSYDLLTDIYIFKNIKDKTEFYQNKYNSVDKDH